MAAPVLQKTWQGGSTSGGTQFVNVVVTGTTPRDTLWAIKNAMVNFFAVPWTVIGSSDGVNSSMDGTDRWIDSGDIVYPTTAGTPFSWIVLQQTGIGATFQVLISVEDLLAADTTRQDVHIRANSGGYGTANGGGDGAINAIPTPSDATKSFELAGVDWLGAEGTPTQMVLTCISSIDGQCTRIIASKQSTGIPIAALGFEVPRLPPATWTAPALMYLFKSTVASGLSCFRWETMADAITNGEMAANVDNVIGPAGFSSITMVPQMPMFSTVEVIDLQEDDRPNPMLYPPMLAGADIGAAAQVVERNYGTLFDWYWCNRNPAGKHLLDMDTIPAPQDATPQNVAQFYEDTSNPISGAEITDAAQTGLDPLEDITLETWVNLDSAVESILIDKYQTPIGAYRLYIQGGNLLKFQSYVTGSNSVIIQIAQTFTPGVWYHVAATRQKSDGALKLFVNGSQIGATEFEHVGVNLLQTNKLFRLGGGNNSLVDLKGFMADTRVWSIVRTPGEIAANYNIALVGNEAGLEGYWPLHTDFNDLTANANNLTAVAGNSTAPAIVPGARPFAGNIVAPRTFVCAGDPVIGWLDDSMTDLNYAKALTIENALKLDDGEYLSIGDGTYAGLNARTCEMWLKIPSAAAGAWRGVYGSGDSHWQQYVIGTGQISSWGDKVNGGSSGAYAWGDSVWFHVAWVYTTTTREIFVNGVSLAAPIAANNVTVSTGTVYLGNTVAGGSTLAIAGSEPCYIADVRHWNFARSAGQILADYQAPLAGNETGLVAYWPLQNDFSQLVSGGPAAWGIAAGTPTIETGVGPVL